MMKGSRGNPQIDERGTQLLTKIANRYPFKNSPGTSISRGVADYPLGCISSTTKVGYFVYRESNL